MMYKVVVEKLSYGFKPVSGDVDKVFKEVYGVRIGGEHIVSFVEALWLYYKGIVEFYLKNHGRLSLSDIIRLSSDKDLWIMFTVYTDLRSKGRKPRVNVLSKTLSITKDKNVIEIIVLEESSLLLLNELILTIDNLFRKDRNVVLGLVDKHGDVTYYQVVKMGMLK